MASYTDNAEALSRFNPYVQQLPVEAMVEVGMKKQQMYNEGIQKIQTNIDNIAGLDVIRGVDKKYLQSKLNALGNNIRTVAAGDFSDFQLVNSASGMVNQIAKDKNVQNAVASSSRYRKEVALMEEARKKGESSPSNEYIFNKDSSEWLNSDDINSSYKGSYNKYTNWKKNSIEVIKALTKSENVSDNAFTTDKNGNLVISDAIIRTKLAGISPEQIQQAMAVGLTPADFKQMEIDGRYTYANADPYAMLGTIKQSSDADIKAMSAKRDVLQNALTTTTSAPEKQKLTEQVEAMDKYISRMHSDYEGIARKVEAGEDIEGIKANYYTTKQMNGFAQAFSHTETSQTVEASPYADMEMRRQVKNQDFLKFKMTFGQNERFHQDKMAIDLANLSEKQKENKLKEKELAGYGALEMPIDQKDIPQYNLAKVMSDIKQTENNIQAADNALMKSQGNKDEAWLAQQKEAWKARPNSVDPVVAQHFAKTEPSRRQMQADAVMIGQISKEATAKFGDLDTHIPKDMRGLNIKTASGTMSITPKEFANFNDKLNNYIKIYTPAAREGGTGITKTVYDDERAKKEMSAKEYYLFGLYKKEGQEGRKSLGAGEQNIMNKVRDVRARVNDPYGKIIGEINKYTGEEVTKRLAIFTGAEHTISTATPAQRADMASNLAKFADFAETQKGGIANSPEFDVKTARLLVADANARYNFKVVEGTERAPAMYQMTVTGEKGNVVKLRVTPEQKRSMFGGDFEAPREVQAIRPYQEQIKKMGGTSTAFTDGPTNRGNAFLNKTDFPNAGIYGVTGNIETHDGGQTYSVRLNLYNPETGKWVENIPYPPSGMVTEKRLALTMSSLNDSVIHEILTHQTASSKSLKQAKNASNKSL